MPVLSIHIRRIDKVPSHGRAPANTYRLSVADSLFISGAWLASVSTEEDSRWLDPARAMGPGVA